MSARTVLEPGVLHSSTARAARGSTGEYHSQFSLPSRHANEQPQLVDGRQPPSSHIHRRRPGQPGRQLYVREEPPPLVDAESQVCWNVDYIRVARSLIAKQL